MRDNGMQCLTEAETAVLSAVLARLIPADENGPGAGEARVIDYVDRALAGPLEGHRESYRANLPALDAYARGLHGEAFAALGAVQQDAVLAALEDGSATGFDPSSRAFFDLVRVHAIEGMFGDPSHGGNAGHVGWKLIGFPGPLGTFTEADQQAGTEVLPVWADG